MDDQQQIDSTIDVVTPENISFQYQVAGPFRRLPAFVIDLLVRVGLWAAILIFSMMLLSQLNVGLASIGIAVWIVAWFILEWFYGGILETFWNGQTIGKRLLGMRVLRTDGQPINGFQAVARNILRLVDLMPLIPLGVWEDTQGPWIMPTCLIGLATSLMNRRYQRLGDLVCGTMVVVEQRRALSRAARVADDPHVRQLAEQIPVGFAASRKLSNALGAYMERRRYLGARRRDEVASHLGEPLAARLGLPTDTNYDQLLCAMYYRTFLSGQSEGTSAATLPLTKRPVPTKPDV